MGLLSQLLGIGQSRVDEAHTPVKAPHFAKDASKAATPKTHVCQVESLEPRCMLAADIHFGGFYFEEATGDDSAGDTIEVTFEGGAAGTTLDRVVINGDKLDDGSVTLGDVFFDLESGGLGVFNAVGLDVQTPTGFTIDNITFGDGIGSGDGAYELAFDLTGFTAGDKLIFTVDVDEQGLFSSTALAEGGEFEGTRLTGFFSADHYLDAEGTATYFDRYDDNFAAAALQTGSVLNLPPDDFMPPDIQDRSDRTAGAVLPITQLPEPITIAGTVFEDFNRNNNQDPGDPGIENVNLELLRLESGTYIATGLTTVTDANGDYKFEGPEITPGDYRVVETQPAGFLSVGAQAGTVDGVTEGSVLTADIITDVTVNGGQDSIDNDFAETKPAELSGIVYHDRNNDCDQDAGEEGIAGVTIELQPVNVPGLTSSIFTTTNAAGEWSFTNLMPGEYRVVEVQPATYLDGCDEAGTAGGSAVNPGDEINGIVLAGNQSGRNYKFGEYRPGSISGHVHADTDGNCEMDPGEEMLEGVLIQLLDKDGNVIAETTTASDGSYLFDNLEPGTYGIREFTPVGYFDGGEKVGTGSATYNGLVSANDLMTEIEVNSGENLVHFDFCEVPPASISGMVHADTNGNCEFDPGEERLSGVVIQLLNADGDVIDQTTTNVAGRYVFDNLPAGTYSIREFTPDGYFDGDEKVGTGSATNNGIVAGNDLLSQIEINPGERLVNYDFCELLPGSIQGRVHADIDGDCQYDPGEPLLSGVVVQLLNSSGDVIDQTLTDANGEYKFDNLAPGSYGVREFTPVGYFDGGESIGTGSATHNGVISGNDLMTEIEVNSGETLIDYDFCEQLPGSIRGIVYADPNQNCIVDSGEPRLEGALVQLLNADGDVIGQTTTDANGEYVFDNLRPGTYGVREFTPDGYFDGGEQIGTGSSTNGGVVGGNDLLTLIEINSGDDLVDYNFCELPPATLSGFVFQDGDVILTPDGLPPADLESIRDGQLTPDDTRLAGVQLELRHGVTGLPISSSSALPGTYSGTTITTTTNANGFYQFTGLRPGIYAVYQVQPDGYYDSLDTAGSLGGLAINPRSGLNPFVLSQLQVNPQDDAIIRIGLAAGQNSRLNNFSEIIVDKEPVIPPPQDPDPNPPFPANPLAAPALPPELPLVVNPLPNILPEPIGAGGDIVWYTWHLSVVNAGHPRNVLSVANMNNDEIFEPSGFAMASQIADARWQIQDVHGQQWQPSFGGRNSIPVTGDFNGDGVSEIGVYVDGHWYIDVNGNGVWDEDDLWAKLGTKDDKPVVGDWDGDGKDDIGIFGPAWAGDPKAVAAEPGLPDANNLTSGKHKNLPPQEGEATLGDRTLQRTAHGVPRKDVIDHVFNYGSPLDEPVTGDWDGDGIHTIAIFRDGVWYMDVDGSGRWSEGDRSFHFGKIGDKPLIGDWNGDGIDQVGVYRDGTWILDSNGNGQLDDTDKVFELGGAGDKPVVGDWDGDGADQPGVFNSIMPERAAQRE